MKKYALILTILVLVGLALAFTSFTQGQRLDKDAFIETTESIRNLQSLDKGMLLLIYQSRYDAEFDNDELFDTNEQISEEFDNLRYEALYNEIQQSASLNTSISQFEEYFNTRKVSLEEYIGSNVDISNSLINISILTYQLTDEQSIGSNASFESISFQALLGKINALIYDVVIGEELQKEVLENDRNQLITIGDEYSFENQERTQGLIGDFVSDINTILANYQPSKEQFGKLNSLNASQLLNDIEDQYTVYHNEAITKSNQFRNALLIYGLCLLTALLFFAWQIRKNYLYMGQQVAEQTKEIKEAYDDLKESQEQLIQSEKMASLGEMVAGVAHEINTPLGYVTSNVDILKVNFEDIETLIKMLGETTDEMRKDERDKQMIRNKLSATIKLYEKLEANVLAEENIQLLSDGAYGLTEISKLVTSLKDFARLDRQNTEQIDVHDCIENSVIIASNHIKGNNVTVTKEYDEEIPKITCFPSKLNQLFLNIITNACQSMKEKGGTLAISTTKHSDKMTIRFQDEGCGMDEETKQRMFDPFYTSKDIGEGTGLGMSIAYKIIEAHHGSINVESTIGEGTAIDVCLPYNATNE